MAGAGVARSKSSSPCACSAWSAENFSSATLLIETSKLMGSSLSTVQQAKGLESKRPKSTIAPCSSTKEKEESEEFTVDCDGSSVQETIQETTRSADSGTSLRKYRGLGNSLKDTSRLKSKRPTSSAKILLSSHLPSSNDYTHQDLGELWPTGQVVQLQSILAMFMLHLDVWKPQPLAAPSKGQAAGHGDAGAPNDCANSLCWPKRRERFCHTPSLSDRSRILAHIPRSAFRRFRGHPNG